MSDEWKDVRELLDKTDVKYTAATVDAEGAVWVYTNIHAPDELWAAELPGWTGTHLPQAINYHSAGGEFAQVGAVALGWRDWRESLVIRETQDGQRA